MAHVLLSQSFMFPFLSSEQMIFQVVISLENSDDIQLIDTNFDKWSAAIFIDNLKKTKCKVVHFPRKTLCKSTQWLSRALKNIRTTFKILKS